MDVKPIVEDIVADLTVIYGDQPTFDAKKIEAIVKKAVEEVITARKYKEVGYTDEQVGADLPHYRSNIFGLAEYDFSHFGAPYETTHAENQTTRTWIAREKLFSGIIPLARF